MRPPVQILKFLAIDGAENRDAEGEEKPIRGLGEHCKLSQWGTSFGVFRA